MAPLATVSNVHWSLKSFGRTRTLKTQQMTEDTGRGKLTGSVLLGIGIRETWLRNILGGAIQNEQGVWIPEPDWTKKDAGVLQISKKYHKEALQKMRAVRNATWYPTIEGKTAYDEDMVPMYSDALQFVLRAMGQAIDYADDHEVPGKEQQRFAIAAHNAGIGGALGGWQVGDVDKYTTGGDYSAWVLDAKDKVEDFIAKRPTWQVA